MRINFIICAILALFALALIAIQPGESDAITPVIGDADCNGNANSVDALHDLRAVAGFTPAACIDLGNVKCDDALNAIDALYVLRYVAALPVNLPQTCPLIGSTIEPTTSPTSTLPASPTSTATPSATPAGTPSGSDTATTTPTATPTPTAVPSGSQSATPMLTPTATLVPTPTPTATPVPTPSPTPEICDGGIASNETDPVKAAKAMGICSVVSAQWVLADGSTTIPTPTSVYHRSHSIRSQFGQNSTVINREGSNMLLLSTGTSAGIGQVNPPYVAPTPGLDKQYAHAYPVGFPKSGELADGVSCPTVLSPRDGIGLKLVLTAPPGATGFSFDWDFFTSDYPQFVCSQYNDVAAVMVNGVNVMDDGNGAAIDVNSSYVNVCDSGTWGQGGSIGDRVCVGTGHLIGTGYEGPPPIGFSTDQGAATDWRTSTNGAVSITPGEVYTFTFAIWDSSDGGWDSTVLFDNFHWTYN